MVHADDGRTMVKVPATYWSTLPSRSTRPRGHLAALATTRWNTCRDSARQLGFVNDRCRRLYLPHRVTSGPHQPWFEPGRQWPAPAIGSGADRNHSTRLKAVKPNPLKIQAKLLLQQLAARKACFMRFSEHFGVARTPEDDWFDPHLTVDTKLFIDPLLMLEAGGEWKKAHDDLLAHFVYCYELVAKSREPESLSSKTARNMLTFPEPYELGLGYTSHGTKGSGGGKGFAQSMLDGIRIAIAAGLKKPEHIEEIGILNEGIGADRISDATANIIKAKLISYTQSVAERHGIPMEKHRVKNSRVVAREGRWMSELVHLPTNPMTEKPILLVPESILGALPILNADDWFYSDLNEDLRTSMNMKIGCRARKADIVQWARQHPQRVVEWVRTQTERGDLCGYDFTGDPAGVVKWDIEGERYARLNPLALREIRTNEDLIDLVDDIVSQFKHFIEQQRGWSLLHNSDGKEKPEESIQLLFLGMAQPYLRHFDVELDREVELGRGPVDFKVSRGSSIRLVIEVKKLLNGKFWHGLHTQLPSYMFSDDTLKGWFIAVDLKESNTAKNRIRDLPDMVKLVCERSGKRVEYTVIDGKRPRSASNI